LPEVLASSQLQPEKAACKWNNLVRVWRPGHRLPASQPNTFVVSNALSPTTPERITMTRMKNGYIFLPSASTRHCTKHLAEEPRADGWRYESWLLIPLLDKAGDRLDTVSFQEMIDDMRWAMGDAWIYLDVTMLL
jgi:hypothetical protein